MSLLWRRVNNWKFVFRLGALRHRRPRSRQLKLRRNRPKHPQCLATEITARLISRLIQRTPSTHSLLAQTTTLPTQLRWLSLRHLGNLIILFSCTEGSVWERRTFFTRLAI